MVNQKSRPVENQDLDIERVERVGDYFKSLFVRSLRLGLDDGVRKHPGENAAELNGAADSAADKKPGEDLV